MAQHVTVYTTPTCPKCNVVKKWLAIRNVEYIEVRVDRDEGAAALLKSKGYTEAPVLRIIRANGAEVWWSGFRPSQMSTLEPTGSATT